MLKKPRRHRRHRHSFPCLYMDMKDFADLREPITVTQQGFLKPWPFQTPMKTRRPWVPWPSAVDRQKRVGPENHRTHVPRNRVRPTAPNQQRPTSLTCPPNATQSGFEDCFQTGDVADMTFACIGAVDASIPRLTGRAAPENDERLYRHLLDNASALESSGEYTQGAEVAPFIRRNPRQRRFQTALAFQPRQFTISSSPPRSLGSARHLQRDAVSGSRSNSQESIVE